MTVAFVLDSSVALTWCFRDEATKATTELLNRLETDGALVPTWWFLEVANVLTISERRRRITQSETGAFINDLRKLDLQVDDRGSHSRAFHELVWLARDHALTIYDAVYLDLALRKSLPFATLDDDLRQAAAKLGVELLGS